MVLKKRVFLTAMEITPQKGVEFEPNLFRVFSRNPTYFPLCQKQDIQNRCLFPPCCFLTFSLHLKSCLLSKKKDQKYLPRICLSGLDIYPFPCVPRCAYVWRYRIISYDGLVERSTTFRSVFVSSLREQEVKRRPLLDLSATAAGKKREKKRGLAYLHR